VLRRPSRYLDPGVPDQERILARRDTTLVGTVKSGALVDVVAKGGVLAEAAADVRRFVRGAVADSVGRWSPEAAGIVTAIVIGDRTGLDDETERRLQEAGTYHVIAISGGNIAILAGLIVAAFRMSGLLSRSARYAMASAIAALVAYGYLVGGGASVDRATLMAVVYFAGRAVDLRGPPLNSLVLVAGLLVATNPLAVTDPAFLLTFGATASIVLVVPVVPLRRLPRLAAPAAAMCAASMAAEAALLPVAAFIFARVTFAGLVLNFAAIPLMAVAQVAGMALVPAALVSSRLAAALGWVAYIGARGLVASARLVRFAPLATWRVTAPGWLWIGLYYAGIIGAWAAWHRASPCWRAWRIAGIGASLIAAIWILWAPWRLVATRGDGRLHATFLDVGQGDAAFIQFPRGAAWLVDTGGLVGNSGFDIGDRVVAPVLRAAGVGRLQSITLTHGDGDHIGGAPSLLREFTPLDVWEGIPVPSFGPLRALKAAAATTGSRWTNVQRADATTIDGVRIVVRHPGVPDWERQQVRNDDSIVLDLTWNDVSLVMAGDIGKETEEAIAPLFPPRRLRVLKVPHHGSATSSTEGFIRALAPRIAIVSVGRSNTFGHPSPAVLERYRAAGAALFRTDQDGAVMLDTDGVSIDVHTFTGRTLSVR
jgi:competence protein ComEC